MNTAPITSMNASAPRSKTAASALALALAACVALVGCGNESGKPADSAPAQAGTAAPAGSSAPASSTSTTAPSDNADSTPAPAAPKATQETVAGTLELFIAAMEQGDFEAGAEFVDPTTELYAEMIKMAENIEAASAHQDPQKGNVGEFLRLSFAVTFAGGEYTVLSEEGNRARAQLTLPNAKLQHTVSLNQVQGKWYILAGRELLRQTGRPAPTPSTP